MKHTCFQNSIYNNLQEGSVEGGSIVCPKWVTTNSRRNICTSPGKDLILICSFRMRMRKLGRPFMNCSCAIWNTCMSRSDFTNALKLSLVNIYIRVFHNLTKLAMLALLPTLYSHIFTVFFFICSNCCQ